MHAQPHIDRFNIHKIKYSIAHYAWSTDKHPTTICTIRLIKAASDGFINLINDNNNNNNNIRNYITPYLTCKKFILRRFYTLNSGFRI